MNLTKADGVTKSEDFGVSLSERLKAKFAKASKPGCVLADISGSMGGAPIMKLRELMNQFKDYRRFTFHDYVQELQPHEQVGEAQNTTDMTGAFKHIKGEGITHIVMITDGGPNNAKTALDESDGLKIDIFYVGTGIAPPFLADLAKKTGGKFGCKDIKDVQQLEDSIKGLLAAPSKSIAL